MPHSLLLITRVNDFAAEILKNDEDHHVDEVLRKRIHAEHELEYMRKFEKAFAIDRLEEYVATIIRNR